LENKKAHVPDSILVRSQKLSFHQIKAIIADIATEVTSNPEGSLSRKTKLNLNVEDHDDHIGQNRQDAEKTEKYKLTDLFEFLNHDDARIVELAMLSCVLIFKDIVPGYKIRLTNDDHKLDPTLGENDNSGHMTTIDSFAVNCNISNDI
jgi:hypothetical protein